MSMTEPLNIRRISLSALEQGPKNGHFVPDRDIQLDTWDMLKARIRDLKEPSIADNSQHAEDLYALHLLRPRDSELATLLEHIDLMVGYEYFSESGTFLAFYLQNIESLNNIQGLKI